MKNIVRGKSITHMANMKMGTSRDGALAKLHATAQLFLSRYGDAMELVDCPACGGAQRRQWAAIAGFVYSKCLDCGLVYLNPHPTEEMLLEYYTSPEFGYCDTYSRQSEEVLKLRREFVSIPRLRFVQQFVDARTWIDLGAGNGDMVAALLAEGIDAVGIEPSESCVAFAADHFGVGLDARTVCKFILGCEGMINVDVVSMFGVLEHVANPNRLLQSLAPILAPNVRLALLLPKATSLSSILQRIDPRLLARHVYPPAHVTLWGYDSADAILSQNGLEIEGIWTYGQDAFELAFHLSDVLDEEEHALVQSFLPHLQSAVDEADLSDELLVLAKKV